jgi:hypothetical protein
MQFCFFLPPRIGTIAILFFFLPPRIGTIVLLIPFMLEFQVSQLVVTTTTTKPLIPNKLG